MLPKGFGFALACLLVWVAPSARGDVIYKYTGPLFTNATSPYTTSDSVTATFQLPNQLAGNLSNFTICNGNCAIPFSISDGVETLTNANNASLNNFAAINTDAAGIPTQWGFNAQNLAASVNIFSRGGNQPFGAEPGDGVMGSLGICGVQFCASVHYTAGPQFWSVVPVPEPSTLTLSTIGLVLLGALTRRKKA